MSTIVPVVAGAVARDKRFLLCRRPVHKARGGQWEFPGGKIEAGESPGEALERELSEELGVKIRAGKTLACVEHRYPELTIRLILLTATLEQGEPRLLEHTEFIWATPEEALTMDLCPADRTLAEKLMENSHDI